jgi:hypothetical protein
VTKTLLEIERFGNKPRAVENEVAGASDDFIDTTGLL